MPKLDILKRLKTGASEAALSFGRRMKSGLLVMVSKNADDVRLGEVPNGHTAPTKRTPMQAILDQRAGLQAQIEAAANCGYVRDSLAVSLLANYEDELAERRRLLTDLEHQLQASLRRLNALCPTPPAPEPAPLPPPRARKFMAVKDWFGNGAAGRVN